MSYYVLHFNGHEFVKHNLARTWLADDDKAPSFVMQILRKPIFIVTTIHNIKKRLISKMKVLI